MNLQMSLLAVVCHTDKPLNLNDEFQVSPMPPAPSPSAPFSTHTKTFPFSWISCSICFTCWPNVHVQHTCPFIFSMYWAFPERCCWHAGAHIFSLCVQIVPPVANLHYRMFIMFAIPVTMCPSWRAGTKVWSFGSFRVFVVRLVYVFFPSGWLAQSIPVRCPRCKPLLLPAHGAGFANDVNIYFWRQTKDVQRKFEIRNVICPSHFGSNHFGSTLGSSVFARSR